MSLKERISADIDRIFVKEDQFATTHYWNGKEILCVTDEEEALKRKNNNVNDISWQANTRKILIYVNASQLADSPEAVEPNTHIFFDRRPMRILSVEDNMGMLSILLEAKDPREVI